MALHRCASFADRGVTWQIGVTSTTALRGTVYDEQGDCDRIRALRLEAPLPANSCRSRRGERLLTNTRPRSNALSSSEVSRPRFYVAAHKTASSLAKEQDHTNINFRELADTLMVRKNHLAVLVCYDFATTILDF